MNGTIYKISTEKSDKVYVGSTTQPLNFRMAQHRHKRTCSCRELLELGECKIEALEVLYNCTKRELQIKEQEYLELLKEKAVNKQKAIRTKEEQKEYNRLWREANRQETNRKRKESYYKNKEYVKKSNSEAV